MRLRHWSAVLLLCCGVAAANADDTLRQRVEAWSAGYPAQALGVDLVNSVRLREIYDARRYQPVWFKTRRDKELAHKLIARIGSIDADGLLPTDYHWTQLQSLLQKQQVDDPILHDLLLSDAFISLVDNLLAGKVDPESLTLEWKANRRKSDAKAVLEQLLASSDPQAVLDSLLPAQIRYTRLKQALAHVRKLEPGPWQPLAATPVIKPGASDARLQEISRRLQLWGDLQVGLSADVYGAELQQALQNFQSRHGLQQDAIIGAQTIKALNVSPQQRAQQIVVNLERWRWLPEDLGKRFMVVNLAAFELKIIEDDITVFEKPVIVGRNQRKTPVFSDTIRYVVFNPTWTVPPRLALQDKLPEIKRDPQYLQRMGFSVYPFGEAKPVDPANIDWSLYGKGRFPFRLVQAPGPLNALGQVKFMFPNAYDIYLHDTPSRELFQQSSRAFSSGCIRVFEPLGLAEFLLRSAGWDSARIGAVLASGKPATVHLRDPLPIHMEYWTAWVGSNEQLNFREDIYNRDLPLWNALQSPRVAAVVNLQSQ